MKHISDAQIEFHFKLYNLFSLLCCIYDRHISFKSHTLHTRHLALSLYLFVIVVVVTTSFDVFVILPYRPSIEIKLTAYFAKPNTLCEHFSDEHFEKY